MRKKPLNTRVGAACFRQSAVDNIKIEYRFEGSEYYKLKSQTPTSIEIEKDGKSIKMGLVKNTIKMEDVFFARPALGEYVPCMLGAIYVIPDEGLELKNIMVVFTYLLKLGDVGVFGRTLFQKAEETLTSWGFNNMMGEGGQYSLPLDRSQNLIIGWKRTFGIFDFGFLPLEVKLRIDQHKSIRNPSHRQALERN